MALVDGYAKTRFALTQAHAARALAAALPDAAAAEVVGRGVAVAADAYLELARRLRNAVPSNKTTKPQLNEIKTAIAALAGAGRDPGALCEAMAAVNDRFAALLDEEPFEAPELPAEVGEQVAAVTADGDALATYEHLREIVAGEVVFDRAVLAGTVAELAGRLDDAGLDGDDAAWVRGLQRTVVAQIDGKAPFPVVVSRLDGADRERLARVVEHVRAQ